MGEKDQQWPSLMRDESVSPYAKEGFGSGYASEGASGLIVQFIAQRKQEPSSKNADCRTGRREFASRELIHSVSPEVFQWNVVSEQGRRRY